MMNRRLLVSRLLLTRWLTISGAALPMALFAQSRSQAAGAKATHLPLARNLRDLALAQTAKGQPLVIMVSLPRCPYCELVRRNYLLPYRAEGLLNSWQIDTTDHSALIDFAGKPTTPAAWSQAMRVKVMPTLLFFDQNGREIAPRLEGVAVPDFYGAYLDERLATARQRLNRDVDMAPVIRSL
jgi:thioredoxin-related protein